MNGATTIRVAEASDLDDLVRLENEAFAGDRLARRDLLYAIRSPTIVTLAADRGGRLAGYAFAQTRRGSTVARLTSIAVAQDFVGQGLGRVLVESVEAAALARGCDRIRLEVRADNGSAVRLYERGGYRAVGEIPDYYEDGETARSYEKRLRSRPDTPG